MADEMMTKQEAADNLKLALRTLERRLRDVSIPAVTFRRLMLLRRETLGPVLRAHERRWASTATAEVATNGLPAGEG